jgi:hypothetical protein
MSANRLRSESAPVAAITPALADVLLVAMRG